MWWPLRVLDVGSGTPSIYHHYLEGDQIIHIDINKTAFHLEVLCDAYYLPFRDNCFEIVHASHILEHLENPIAAIKEMHRVARKVVIIKVPNATYYKLRSSSPHHIFSWNEWTLYNLLSRFFKKVEIYKNTRCPQRIPKLKKLLRFIERFFMGQNELIAICYK